VLNFRRVDDVFPTPETQSCGSWDLHRRERDAHDCAGQSFGGTVMVLSRRGVLPNRMWGAIHGVFVAQSDSTVMLE
jgi:hypothetical protein